MALTLVVFLCLASGYLLVSVGWTRVQPGWCDFLLRASLAIGFGLGVFSVAFLVYRVFEFTSLIAVDLAFFLPLLCAKLLFGSRAAAIALPHEEGGRLPKWFQATLGGSLAVALCVAVYAAIRQTLAHPHGDGWDAFAIWNLHARFLFLDGSHWRDGFTPLLPWSHPDYPLLLPAAIAHFWNYLGYDAPLVSALVGLAFLFGTVGILFGGLAVMRGTVQATLAAIALLATPAFVEQGTWQYADVPLSFFSLAAVALLCLHDEAPRKGKKSGQGLLFVAGIAAGFAAWTKNEGILFLAALVLGREWTVIRDAQTVPHRDSPFVRHRGAFLTGILPLFLVVVAFKHWIAPPGDLFSDGHSILQRLVQPSRYWAVLQWYGKEFLRFGDWLALPGTLLLGGLYYVQRGSGGGWEGPGWRVSVMALGLTFTGYALIYLITPYDIYWHLRFSLGRLFLQLWPTAIFVGFLSMPPFGEEGTHRRLKMSHGGGTVGGKDSCRSLLT